MTKNNFAANLQKAMNNAGFNIRVLSEESGITASQIRNFEQGKQSPKIASLTALAIALNVETDQLLGLKPLKVLYRTCGTCKGTGRVRVLEKE
jgi:transcriptional regulator with XRE-family HTH domain